MISTLQFIAAWLRARYSKPVDESEDDEPYWPESPRSIP